MQAGFEPIPEIEQEQKISQRTASRATEAPQGPYTPLLARQAAQKARELQVDPPAQQPMRASADGKVRRNPSTDQKRVRRQMTRRSSLRTAARPDDIVGYTYLADVYCPDDTVRQFMARNSQAPMVNGLSPEDALATLAEWAGIDRMNESSYDSDDFPKVVFRDSAEGYTDDEGNDQPERCGACGKPLDDISSFASRTAMMGAFDAVHHEAGAWSRLGEPFKQSGTVGDNSVGDEWSSLYGNGDQRLEITLYIEEQDGQFWIESVSHTYTVKPGTDETTDDDDYIYDQDPPVLGGYDTLEAANAKAEQLSKADESWKLGGKTADLFPLVTGPVVWHQVGDPIVGIPQLCANCNHPISDHFNNGTRGCDLCECSDYQDPTRSAARKSAVGEPLHSEEKCPACGYEFRLEGDDVDWDAPVYCPKCNTLVPDPDFPNGDRTAARKMAGDGDGKEEAEDKDQDGYGISSLPQVEPGDPGDVPMWPIEIPPETKGFVTAAVTFEDQVQRYINERGFDRATAEMLTREQGIVPEGETAKSARYTAALPDDSNCRIEQQDGTFYAACNNCPYVGPNRSRQQDAERDATAHDQNSGTPTSGHGRSGVRAFVNPFARLHGTQAHFANHFRDASMDDELLWEMPVHTAAEGDPEWDKKKAEGATYECMNCGVTREYGDENWIGCEDELGRSCRPRPKTSAVEFPPELDEITNKTLLSIIKESDWYDPWGASMGWHFAIADWLTDNSGSIAPEWNYTPGMGGSATDAYEYQSLEEGSAAGQFSVADVEQAGGVLDKLENRLTAEGKDY